MTTYTLWVKSPRSFFKATDYLAAVKLHCEMLPEYMPMRWGWTETRKPFHSNQIEELVFANGEVDDVFWRRTGENRAFGSWMTRLRNVDISKATHSSIHVDVYKTTYQKKLLSYLKTASQCFDADISTLDSNVDNKKKLVEFVYHLPSGVTSIETICGGIDLMRINHWLPDMPWAVVFGPAYVRMFGKDRLLSTPAYKVEDIGPEMVFIQLTPNMEDIHKKYDEVMQARTIAKHHLGEECFFKPELAYDYREHPEKAGKVFRVPVFELKPD